MKSYKLAFLTLLVLGLSVCEVEARGKFRIRGGTGTTILVLVVGLGIAGKAFNAARGSGSAGRERSEMHTTRQSAEVPSEVAKRPPARPASTASPARTGFGRRV